MRAGALHRGVPPGAADFAERRARLDTLTGMTGNASQMRIVQNAIRRGIVDAHIFSSADDVTMISVNAVRRPLRLDANNDTA